MKKIYLLMAAAAFSTSGLAQLKHYDAPVQTLKGTIDHTMMEKGATTDTSGWTGAGNFYPDFATSGGVFVYGWGNGGYAFGSNADTLNMVTQGYENANNSTIEIKEVLLWFGAKDDQSSGAGTMNINIFGMAENAAYSNDGTDWNLDKMGPTGAAVATETLTIADADTLWPNLTSVMLSSPVSITGNFAVELDAYDFINTGDTICLLADDDGDGQEMAYYRYDPTYTFWVLVKSSLSSGTDNNVGIFAVIGDNNVGIESNEYYNGVQLSAFPVPAVSNTTIAFNLERNFSKVTLKIMDAKGAVVSRTEKGALSQGEYKEVIDVTEFAAGSYYYTLYAEGTKLTKKFVVVK